MGKHSAATSDNQMHGIVWKTVANAAALAGMTIAAGDVSNRKIVLQSDTGQLWVPLSTTPTFAALLTRQDTLALGNSGAAKTIDLTLAANQSIVINQNTTLTITKAAVDGIHSDLDLVFSGGAHTIAWVVTGGSLLWAAGSPPILDTTGNPQVITLKRRGANVLGQATPSFF